MADLVGLIALSVKPRRAIETENLVLRWHRAGWRLFWRCKSQPGRI
jgi:hypothetical protein